MVGGGGGRGRFPFFVLDDPFVQGLGVSLHVRLQFAGRPDVVGSPHVCIAARHKVGVMH